MSNSGKVCEAISLVRQMACGKEKIDPFFVCKLFGIVVIDTYKLDKEGYFVCKNGYKLIFVSSNVINQHRKEFIVAHELGHYLMHGNQLYGCTNIGLVQNQQINTPMQEKEANEFASELLLPTELLKKQLPLKQLSFDVVIEIANIYDVSVTMTAIKAIQNSKSEDEILLCYEEGILKWFASTNKNIKLAQIPARCPMDLDSNSNYGNVTMFWDDIFVGSVQQEVFRTYGEQYLVLLSGNEWNESDSDGWY